jgi:hypothetical protein
LDGSSFGLPAAIHWIPSRVPDQASEAETAKLLRVVKDRLRNSDAWQATTFGLA